MQIHSKSICPECDYNEAMFQLIIARLETLFCPRCGFESSINYSNNKKKRKTAHGACRMQFSKGHARVAAVVEPITAEIIDNFQQMINSGKIMESGSYLTRWDSDRKFGELIIGSTKYISFM